MEQIKKKGSGTEGETQWTGCSEATCVLNECEDDKERKLAEQKRQFWTA